MRLLLAGRANDSSLESSYARAINRLPDVEAVQVDIAPPRTRLGHYQGLTQAAVLRNRVALVRALERDRDYDGVIVFKGYFVPPAVIERLRKMTPGCLWFNINPDDPFATDYRGTTNRWVRRSVCLYDAYSTWTTSKLEPLRAAGQVNPFVLPFGFDRERHRPTRLGNLRRSLSFVGSWDPQREALLRSLEGLPLDIMGPGWERMSLAGNTSLRIRPGRLTGRDLVDVVAQSTASINLLRPQNAASHNMRTFEIPAMGGLLLTQYSKEQASWFEPGKAALMFKTAAQLRHQGELVLCDPDMAMGMRNASLRAVRLHSYDERAANLISVVRQHMHSR